MAINLEPFFDEFVGDYDHLVGRKSQYFEPGRRVLWMVCCKQYNYDYSITRQSEQFNIDRTELDRLLRTVLPSEYFEEQALERLQHARALHAKK